MARTTTELVAAILTPNGMNDPDDDLTPFIDTANILVTRKCASRLKPDGSAYYSDDDLEMIERWLACHFYKIPNPDNLKERVSRDAENQIESKVDLGLNVTRYGQQVAILDDAGGLSEMSKKGWGVYWLGTRPEDNRRRVQ